MPHKCVKCGATYGDRAGQLLKGCGCGSRIFLFLREDQISVKEKMESLQRETTEIVRTHAELQELSEVAPISIEKAADEGDKPAADISKEIGEFTGWRGEIKPEPEEDFAPRAENVRIIEKGTYELDLKSLMSGNPLVIRSHAGVFYIRIPSPVGKRRRK
jgi:predicted  nucleic acid-binding Zn-ribbon protein